MFSEAVYGAQIEGQQPTVSSRRRLQNRTAQRKFRERRALKNLSLEDNPEDWMFTTHTDTDTGRPYAADDQPGGQDRECFLEDQFKDLDSTVLDSDPSLHFHSSDPAGAAMTHMGAAPDARQHPAGCYPPTPSSSLDSSSISSGGATALAYPSEYASLSPTRAGPSGSNMSYRYNDDELLRTNYTARISPPSESTTSTSSHEHSDPQLCISLVGAVIPTSGASNQSLGQADGAQLPPLLHTAARSCNPSVAATLLRRGAVAVDERDKYGRTALHIAAELGDETTVSLLLRYSADPRLRDSRGQSALYMAVSGGHNDVVELLLESGEVGPELGR